MMLLSCCSKDSLFRVGAVALIYELIGKKPRRYCYPRGFLSGMCSYDGVLVIHCPSNLLECFLDSVSSLSFFDLEANTLDFC